MSYFIINIKEELPETAVQSYGKFRTDKKINPKAKKDIPIYITDFYIDPKTGKEDLSKPFYSIRRREDANVKEILEETKKYLERITERRMNEEW